MSSQERLLVDVVSASDFVNESMTEYGTYLKLSKLPSIIDGLKRVHRRFLYVMKGTVDEERKLDTFSGEVCGQIHPHGAKSVIDAITRASQQFAIGYPLISASSSKGSYLTPNQAAASRYFNCCISEFAQDVFWNGVNIETLPMRQSEHNYENVFEPIYLIPRLPTALLYAFKTIGCGFKGEYVPFNIVNVCELVMKHIDNPRGDWRNYGDYLIPHSPIPGYVINYYDILDSIRNGNQRPNFTTEGSIVVTPTSIIVNTAAHDINFDNVLESLDTMWRKKGTWVNEAVRTYRPVKSLEIEFFKKYNPFDYVEPLKKLLKIRGNIVQIPNYVVEQTDEMITASPEFLLKIWFEERKRSIARGTIYDQKQYVMRKLKNSALLLIHDRMDEVISDIKNTDSGDPIIQLLYDKYGLRIHQAKSIVASSLGGLARTEKSKLIEEQAQIIERLEEIRRVQNDVTSVIYSDAEYFAKKYARKFPRQTYIDPFAGYIRTTTGGIMQFHDNSEAADIVAAHGTDIDRIEYFYPTKARRQELKKYSGHDKPVVTQKTAVVGGRSVTSTSQLPSKVFKGDHLVAPNGKTYTVAFMAPDKMTVVNDVVLPKERDDRFIYVGKRFLAINRDGTVVLDDVSNYSPKKRLGTGMISKMIHAMPHGYGDMLIVYMNTENPNTLRFTRISENEGGRLVFPPIGKNRVLAAVPVNEATDVFVIVPQDCINRIQVNFLLITDIPSIAEKDNLVLDLNTRSGNERRFRKHPDCQRTFII